MTSPLRRAAQRLQGDDIVGQSGGGLDCLVDVVVFPVAMIAKIIIVQFLA